jgi:hypothetical protein
LLLLLLLSCHIVFANAKITILTNSKASLVLSSQK